MLDFHKALLNKEPKQHRNIQTKLRGNRNFLLEEMKGILNISHMAT